MPTQQGTHKRYKEVVLKDSQGAVPQAVSSSQPDRISYIQWCAPCVLGCHVPTKMAATWTRGGCRDMAGSTIREQAPGLFEWGLEPETKIAYVRYLNAVVWLSDIRTECSSSCAFIDQELLNLLFLLLPFACCVMKHLILVCVWRLLFCWM